MNGSGKAQSPICRTESGGIGIPTPPSANYMQSACRFSCSVSGGEPRAPGTPLAPRPYRTPQGRSEERRRAVESLIGGSPAKRPIFFSAPYVHNCGLFENGRRTVAEQVPFSRLLTAIRNSNDLRLTSIGIEPTNIVIDQSHETSF